MSTTTTLDDKVGATVEVVAELEDSAGLPPYEGDPGGGGQPRCQWDEAICTETPTHKILWADGEPGEERTVVPNTYCRRHYALELVQRAAYHEPLCAVALRDHFAGFGPIDEG